tara:strand:+ start:261 stop:749 length:489 start_codon:yes stop_codon:yes gene_type:complete
MSDVTQGQKESMRRKALGELGELFAIKTLVDNGFTQIRNLNDVKMNYPFADLYAEKDGGRYVISVKARNKFENNGINENLRYKLGSKCYENANAAEEEFDAEACWMAIPFDKSKVTIYFGTLKELDGNKAISISKCKSGEIGKRLVNNKEHYFDWDFFDNKR